MRGTGDAVMHSRAERHGMKGSGARAGIHSPGNGDSRSESRALMEKRLPDVEFRWDEPLAHHTTFRVGGRVSCLALPRTEDALAGLVREARREGVPCVILGGGSNVLASDAAMDLLVVKVNSSCCGQIRSMDAGGGKWDVFAGAGVALPRLLGFCLRNGLEGLESLVGIPGTVGGALVMNAGTRDGCITDPLVRVEFLDREGILQRIDRSELPIGYRFTGLPEDCVVTGAHFLLTKADRGILKGRWIDLMRQRKRAQPLGLPSAGCVFKNPVGLSAGALIQRSGFKGFRVGDAQVSEKHANWIVNRGAARAADILALIQQIQQGVFRDFGVLLELEVKVLAHPSEGEIV